MMNELEPELCWCPLQESCDVNHDTEHEECELSDCKECDGK